MSINKIVEGHYNEIINKNVGLMNKRLAICRACRLYTVDDIWGELCNKNLYLNVETNAVSKTPKPGFKSGCGCRLRAKARLEDEQCPIKK